MSNKVVGKGPMKPNQGKDGNVVVGENVKNKEQNDVKEGGKSGNQSGGQPDGHAVVKTELMSLRTHGDHGQQQGGVRNEQHHGIHGGPGAGRNFQQRDRRNNRQNRGDFNRERHTGRDFRERDQNNQNTLAAYEHMGMNEPMPLPEIPKEPKKFTMRCRLFVGNITQDITEDEFREMFEQYGEVSEAFINPSKSFGFIRLDFRHNAEAAKAALDGTVRKGRTLRIRFAAHAGAIKVKNLSESVSNELLHLAFCQFGEIEKAIVIVDDRGKSTGEGIVEFARKQSAQIAFKRINDGAFLLTSSPRPVWVEPLDQKDDEDGLSEKFMNRNSEMYRKEREKEPRFAQPGSFEFEFAQRWKKLVELEKQQQEQMRRVMEDAQLQVEGEMESALMEYQEERLRQDLIRQQEELRRLQEMRQQTDMRRRQDMEIRMRAQEESERQRREEEKRMHERMRLNEEEMRQRQMGPNSLMMGGGMQSRGRPDGLMMQPGMRDGVMRDMPPAGMRDMPPGNMRDMPPGVMRDLPPGAIRDMPPGGMRDMPPGGMRDMPPGGMRDMPPGSMREMPPGGMREMPPGVMREIPPGGVPESQGGNRPLPPPPAPPAGMGVERGQGRRTPDGFPPGASPAGAPGAEPKKENQIQARHGFDGLPGPVGNFGGSGGPVNFPNQGGNMFQRQQVDEPGMRGERGNNPPENNPGRSNERGNAEPERRRGGPAEDFGDMKRMRRY